jgi:hypothetical protein
MLSIHTLDGRGGGEGADSGGGLGVCGETWGWVTSVPVRPCYYATKLIQFGSIVPGVVWDLIF